MSHRRLVRRALSVAACWGVALGFAGAVQTAGAKAGGVVDLPVSFKVKNTNSSDMPCASDGARYTVRGHLVAPRSALDARGRRAITVYLHGFNVGAFMWRLPGFPQLDLPAALARLGHVSLVVDELGYDRSDHPHGLLACLGSQADVTHQLVQGLRSGRYDMSGRRPATFSTVVLAGHDSGAVIADIEAYSYQDIDALVHLTWADQGFTQTAIAGFADLLPVCASGGQPAEQGPPARSDAAGGPSGYVQFLTDATIRAELPDIAPAAMDRLMRLVNRNPCAEFAGAPEAVQLNMQRLPEIRVPVLYGYGQLEFLWTQEGLAQEAQLFRGSRDLTAVVFRNAGHFPQFSRVASVFQSTVAEWLRARRLLSAGALTTDGCPAANRTISGGPGADRLRGTREPENLIGRGGRDDLTGGAGDDCMRGNQGGDRLRGGLGNDRLYGGGGADHLAAGPGNDVLAGGAGDDVLIGGAGRDTFHGGTGNDVIYSADGHAEDVYCGRGRDRVVADRSDRVHGCERVQGFEQTGGERERTRGAART